MYDNNKQMHGKKEKRLCYDMSKCSNVLKSHTGTTRDVRIRGGCGASSGDGILYRDILMGRVDRCLQLDSCKLENMTR